MTPPRGSREFLSALDKASNTFSEGDSRPVGSFTPVLNTRYKTVLVRKPTSSPRGCRYFCLRSRLMPRTRRSPAVSTGRRCPVQGGRDGASRALRSGLRQPPGSRVARASGSSPLPWELISQDLPMHWNRTQNKAILEECPMESSSRITLSG